MSLALGVLLPLLLAGCARAVQNCSFGPSTLEPDVYVIIPCRQPTMLNKTMTSLLDKANLQFGAIYFHFGVDWGDVDTQRAIALICGILKAACTVHEVYDRQGDVSSIVNYVFATLDHQAYYFRYNDDTLMQTDNWNERAITALRKEPTDIGLARIFDTYNPKLQTHSFVSAWHKRIFGYYFPQHFRNLFEDDWVTRVYIPFLHKPSGIQVSHTFQKVRYKIHRVPLPSLARIVQQTQNRLRQFLELRCPGALARWHINDINLRAQRAVNKNRYRRVWLNSTHV